MADSLGRTCRNCTRIGSVLRVGSRGRAVGRLVQRPTSPRLSANGPTPRRLAMVLALTCDLTRCVGRATTSLLPEAPRGEEDSLGHAKQQHLSPRGNVTNKESAPRATPDPALRELLAVLHSESFSRILPDVHSESYSRWAWLGCFFSTSSGHALRQHSLRSNCESYSGRALRELLPDVHSESYSRPRCCSSCGSAHMSLVVRQLTAQAAHRCG